MDIESEEEQVVVLGARVHNLKNIDVSIPRNKLVVVTGMSGSGKSSLAFDTLYAEGQRRYIETFSAYARSFLGALERPDVDQITGLSPVISIEQKSTNRNPRSTVGTSTEIYDFFRLLYARAATAYSYVSGEPMEKHTIEQLVELILKEYCDKKVYLLAPLVRNRKGHYADLFEQMARKGFLTVRIDGKLTPIKAGLKVDRYRNHSIEVVIDKLIVRKQDLERLTKSVSLALKHGAGLMMVMEQQTEQARHYSRLQMCPTSGISYGDPAPHNFSFNSPQGACKECGGLGTIEQIDKGKLIPDPSRSISQGAITLLGKAKNTLLFWQIDAICHNYKLSIDTPIAEFPDEAIDKILYGSNERLLLKNTPLGHNYEVHNFSGVLRYLKMSSKGEEIKKSDWESYFSHVECPKCKGQRLQREYLHYRIDNKNIAEVSAMDLGQLQQWISGLESRISTKAAQIATEILKEIRTRLQFLLDVGLHYLSLNRPSGSLSGGESQRIRLATQIGTQLVNVLYILDEPSIGLHQRDNLRLITSLQRLRDTGNSVIVVEHDEDMMLAADYLVDLGPHAGRLGGEVVFSGTPDEMMNAETMTAQYIQGVRRIEIPTQRRLGNGKQLSLYGATGHNLRGDTLHLPLGMMVCITGVSGSGKSSLINQTLQPILSQRFYRSATPPLCYDRIEGLEQINKVITIDQSPIGRTPRSNPATYTGLFTDIRNLFVALPDAKIRGYKPGRFSFNVSGGRCEECKGNGYKAIEMNFLPDVYVPCERCHGKRYNRETLEVRYRGKSIADVLDMTFNRAVEFFEHLPQLQQKLRIVQQVGLGYIKLGQSSTTLSGGESQRIKIATELAKRDTGNTIYLLDEPTTGLHFEDIRVLMEVLNRLIGKGNTVVVIEHNLDVIKCADYIIDIGPEGGKEGGLIIAAGTPEEIINIDASHTARYLKPILKRGW